MQLDKRKGGINQLYRLLSGFSARTYKGAYIHMYMAPEQRKIVMHAHYQLSCACSRGMSTGQSEERMTPTGLAKVGLHGDSGPISRQPLSNT